MTIRLAVAAVFRRETRYLREWIEFHRLVGVEEFFLYNHDRGDDRKRSYNFLNKYYGGGCVRQMLWDVNQDFQVKAYEDALDLAKDAGVQWLACLDLDEFLFAPDFLPVADVLDSVRVAARPQEAPHAVTVQLRNFGSNGLQYPPMLQTEAFYKRGKDDCAINATSKLVLSVPRAAGYDAAVHDTTGLVVDENGQPRNLAAKKHGSAARLRVNHYGARSLLDWRLREQRGLPPGGFRIAPKDLPNFFTHRWFMLETNAEEDFTIHHYLPALKQAMDIEY